MNPSQIKITISSIMKNSLLLIVAFTWVAFSANASVTLPAIFSDHAVLQKSEKVPIWGKAKSGERVTVKLDKASASAIAGTDGKWKVLLNLKSEGQGPYELVISGANQLKIKDVLIGEVWVCSGQSNMCVSLNDTTGGNEEIKNCSNPLLRQFSPNQGVADPTPQDDLAGHWIIAAPETGASFTGVGYYFGKKIQNELKVPVGLIKTCWGGTPSEAWTSAEALDTNPELKAGKDKIVSEYLNFHSFNEKHKAWIEKYHRQDHPLPKSLDSYTKPSTSTNGWKKVTLPAQFSEIGLPDAGAVWLRKKITLAQGSLNRPTGVSMGDYHDDVTLFWNGRNVGEKNISEGQGQGQGFYISGEFTTPRDVTLVVRIFNPATGMGILPGNLRFMAEETQLEGEWLAKVEYTLPPLSSEAKAALPVQPPLPSYDKTNTATFLFNGMVHPFIPYGIAGVIWYQGEWNASRAYQYRTAFPLLINDWRKKWGQGDFPFYFCQLPNFNSHLPTPSDNDWAELREAQDMTLSLPNTGEAILIDIGEESNIHPRNKKDVGERLALNALAKTYGKKVVYTGPIYDSMKIEGNKIRIKFKNPAGKLVARTLPATYAPTMQSPEATVPLVRNTPDSELEGFAICGEDNKFVWADAKIDGNDIVVSSVEVTTPVAVRYAWAANPICNLYNGDGLPAGPFRTDNLSCTTEKNRY